MKKFINRSNVIFILLLGFLVYKQGPTLINNFKVEGNTIEPRDYPVIHPLQEDDQVQFPRRDARSLAIFWASWCGPCKVEMERLARSVHEGKIARDRIYAINPFETDSVAKEFAAQNNYPFTFLAAAELAQKLNIMATPTVALLDGVVISSLSSGISVIGIWRAEQFLAK